VAVATNTTGGHVIKALARNQNWAKAAPVLGVASAVVLFVFFKPDQSAFWGLLNIPLYLFHQTEEHLWPGGFKAYVNRFVNKDSEGTETLTDTKVFWINILLVWVAFAVFGPLVFVNVGFGLVIIVSSIVNCVTHIVEAIRRKRWNPGLVVASIQFVLSVYGAWFLTSHGLTDPLWWWAGTIAFAAAVHAAVFRIVMSKPGGKRDRRRTA
jgi:hypothetical protein